MVDEKVVKPIVKKKVVKPVVKSKPVVKKPISESATKPLEPEALLNMLEDLEEEKKKVEIEKKRAEKYLSIAGVMVVAINSKGNIILLNKKGYEILGYKESSLIGKNWFDTCIPKRNIKEVKEVFNKLMKGQEKIVEFYENPILRSDGKQRIIAWHNTLLKEEGKIVGTLGSGKDITEKKQAEGELKKSAIYFDIVADAIMVIKPDTKIVKVNKAFSTLWGYSSEEVIGKPVLNEKKSTAFKL